MTTITLPCDKQTRQIVIPDDWLGALIALAPVTAAADANALIRASLARPIGAPPLSALAQAGQRVALLVDDATRKTPAATILPPLLADLHGAGIGRADIAIVLALGTHRPMSDAEIEAKLGPQIAHDYAVVNTPCTERDAFVELGGSAQGIPVQVNRAVVAADLRIGLGMITPHLDTGFSGGCKIVLPGVCAVATVDAFHRASAFSSENHLGNVAAPMRRTLEEFVAAHTPLHFIVNVVMAPAGDDAAGAGLVACVSGDAVVAHRVGVDHARRVYGAPAPRRFPVVVTNCAPYDQDLWQSIKGVWAGDLLTADGGALIMVSAAAEGNSLYPLLPGYIGQAPDALAAAITAGQVQDEKQAATGVMFGRMKQRVRLLLVSDGLTHADAAAMGVDWFATVEQAVVDAVLRLPESVRRGAVAVLPEGGVTLPLSTGFSAQE